MTKERKKEIKKEAKKRIKLWLSATTFEEMTVGGSFVRFNMAIGLLGGYPFEKEYWMVGNDFDEFVTKSEFYSVEYEQILGQQFHDCMVNCG
tara:strand:+ start:873 stop:1148 length:276 start_codon:yes stop_codon:yes gene_type:complete